MPPPTLTAQVIAAIPTVGGALAIGGGLFFTWLKLAGNKWIEERFDLRLKAVEAGHTVELEKLKHQQSRDVEALKHQQSRDIESLKFSQQKEAESLKAGIGAMLDRRVKTNQIEFDIIPDLWISLLEATSQVGHLTAMLQLSSDVSRSSDAELRETLEQKGYKPSDVIYVIEADDRQKAYDRAESVRRYRNAMQALSDYHNFTSAKSLFIPEAAKQHLLNVDKLCHDALVEYDLKINHAHRGRIDQERAHKEVPALIDQIETILRQHLTTTLT